MQKQYPCPICNSPDQYFNEERYEICYVCGWVDCAIQKNEPDNDTGANPISMNEAKRLWYIGESIFPEYPNKTRRVFIIDGNRFKGLKGFYDEMERLFTSNLGWQIGYNLNAFADLVEGGFGVHKRGEPIKIIWRNFTQSRITLGYGSIIRNLESNIARYDKPRYTSRGDIYGVSEMKRQLEEAKSEKGETMVDLIVGIILEQKNCILEIIE